MAEPGIALPLTDGEGQMAQAQARMAAAARVLGGAAEELGQEQGKMGLGFGHVFGNMLLSSGVALDAVVEGIDEALERGQAAGDLVDGGRSAFRSVGWPDGQGHDLNLSGHAR